MSIVRLPVIQSARDAKGATGAIQSDGHRRLIVPAEVRGRWDRARKIVFVLLIGLWIALPWVRIGGAPAVFLDIDARRFFLFGATFNAQDVWLLFFLLSGVGFGLVYITALAGRAWCGWACPQTVFLEGVYRRIDRLFEGSREKQLRRDAGPATFGRALRKTGKHAAFVVASLLVAHVILAYFVSLPRLFGMMRTSPTAHLEAFVWVFAMTALLYGNFAWFREQLCLVLCPYGRLQSVLLDDDSLVVGYDTKRGEPRGKKGHTTGDCVDCNRCVVVCPTGIDIRDGLQLDCIACTACIDACDDVMDRLDRPRGLIRYDSPNGLAGKTKRVLRPRLALYTVLLVLGGVVTAFATHARSNFEAVVTRLPGAPYTVEGGTIRNAFDLHVFNKGGTRDVFAITLDAPGEVTAIVPVARIELDALADAHVPIFVTVPESAFHGDIPLRVRVARDGGQGKSQVIASATLLGAVR